MYGRIAAFFGGGNKNQNFTVRESPLGKYWIPSKYHLYLLKLDDVDDYDDEKNDNDGGNRNDERNTLHMASSM